METKNKKIADLIEAEYNPRQLTEKQHQDLTDSLKRFGVVDPLIVNVHEDRKNIVVGGHQRLRIWRELGHKTIPCVEVELDRDRERELNIRLNRNTGEWDWDALANEFDISELTEWGFEEKELTGQDDVYTTKVEAPVYEPTGMRPNVETLVDSEKYKVLIKDIDNSELSEANRKFLRMAATRHLCFDYSMIAEYYAQASPEMQQLMEDSALVIIDFNKAIEDGYVKLTDRIAKQYAKESE